VDGDPYRAPTAGPRVARHRARDARYLFGPGDIVGERDSSKLAGAERLGCMTPHSLDRLGLAAVSDVERIPCLDDHASQRPAHRKKVRQLIGADIARLSSSDLIAGVDRGPGRYLTTVDPVAEAQHTAPALVGLDHEVVAILGGARAVHEAFD